MSLLQAFSSGMPAIVTDAGGMAEVVRLARAGAVVPLADVSAMKAAIVHLATQTADRLQFSRNAEAAFQTHFTLQAMADAYMALYADTRRYRAKRALSA